MQPRFHPSHSPLSLEVFRSCEKNAFHRYLEWSGDASYEDYRERYDIARRAWVKALDWVNRRSDDDWL